MLAIRDNLRQGADALRSHRLRTVLTVLGLTMGVATLITVMTIVQGANLYVEKKIANLGTDVFQVARTPFAATDFDLITKALKFKHIEYDDFRFVAGNCTDCDAVGASATFTARIRYQDHDLQDMNIIGHTANMADIDTRTVERGRYFNSGEVERAANVCLIGDFVVDQFFPTSDPVGKVIRISDREFVVIGTFEKIGSVLGQEQDNFAIIPLTSCLRAFGNRTSLTLNVLAKGPLKFERAQDQVRMFLRARRHVTGEKAEDFFIGTKDSYISLWKSISSAFFGVFILVSSISAVVGGIVIMNVMLVSVTERTKEIGIRRAVGATRADILRQFLTESVMQCIIGGAVGVFAGFLFALALRSFTAFPASVQAWVAILGVVLSSLIGLFFGIYPAVRASRLEPVVALRTE
ncbi:MAG TPA: ABC transporter permease [Bryobacteraceae bacterium]|nr:ABC transporter permease [Bryobacteraceae bacterium]